MFDTGFKNTVMFIPVVPVPLNYRAGTVIITLAIPCISHW